MADCCGQPSKNRSRSLWVLLVILGLMLTARALWGREAARVSRFVIEGLNRCLQVAALNLPPSELSENP